MTGTNGCGFIGTLTCDADLEKFLQNINVTSTTLVQKWVFLATLLNKLFSSNNAIRVDLKKTFFFD